MDHTLIRTYTIDGAPDRKAIEAVMPAVREQLGPRHVILHINALHSYMNYMVYCIVKSSTNSDGWPAQPEEELCAKCEAQTRVKCGLPTQLHWVE